MAFDIRLGQPDDLLDLARRFDEAVLERPALPTAIEEERVLVAVDDDRVLGGLCWKESMGEQIEIEAIAVAKRHRRQQIGSALIEALRSRFQTGTLTARFETSMAPFYRSCGFEVETTDTNRARGMLKNAGDE